MSGPPRLAAVKRITDRSIFHPADTFPRAQWPALVTARAEFCKQWLKANTSTVHTTCSMLLVFALDGADSECCGYTGLDTYVREGLGLDPEIVTWALEGLRVIGDDVPARRKRLTAPPDPEVLAAALARLYPGWQMTRRKGKANGAR